MRRSTIVGGPAIRYVPGFNHFPLGAAKRTLARYRRAGYGFNGKVEKIAITRGQWVIKLTSTVKVAVLCSREATKALGEQYGRTGAKLKNQTIRAIGNIELKGQSVVITVAKADDLFVVPTATGSSGAGGGLFGGR